jgi:PLP dependent protein
VSDADRPESLARARAHVLERIASACERVGRDAREVTLVGVTKTVPVDRIREAVAAGLSTLGENRVQEAAAKIPSIPGAVWHLVGPLQSNKARRAVVLFDVIETVDSVDLADRLDRLAGELRPGRPLPVLVQVNVDRDPAKAGFDQRDLEASVDGLIRLRNLEVGGLMTVGREVDNPEAARPTFRALRELAERLRARWPSLGKSLSMGMSADFEIAIEEGATIVRVGRALFGERPDHHRSPGEPRNLTARL